MNPKILIVKLSSMGDVIHTFPAAWVLRNAFPDATLGWVVEKAHSELLEGLPWLQRRIVYDRKGLASLWALRRALKKTRWDLAIDFQGLARSALVARLSGARRALGFAPCREYSHWLYTRSAPAFGAECHAVERSLRLSAVAIKELGGADLAGIRHGGQRPEIETPETPWNLPFGPRGCDSDRLRTWLSERHVEPGRDRLVVLFPDCRKPANRWPTEKFTELGRRLLALPGIRVVLGGAPTARALCAAIDDSLGNRTLRSEGQFGLLGTAALLQKAAVVVAGDTGPGHLAVAVGTRLVSLFGPADPARTGPYSRRAIVLSRRLPCSPCFARSVCPLGHAVPPCMDELTVEAAYAAVAQQLQDRDDCPAEPIQAA